MWVSSAQCVMRNSIIYGYNCYNNRVGTYQKRALGGDMANPTSWKMTSLESVWFVFSLTAGT